MRKAAKQIKLLVMYYIYCYVVGKIVENLTGRVIFSKFAGSLLRIHVQILFNTFGNFGEIFFQVALVGCFFKKRMLKRKNVLCNYCAFQKILRGDPAYPGWDEKQPGLI